MPQPQSRQQSQFNEIQMLQRQIMLKQLQELQRQKKLQELNDARQKNVTNQQSLIQKQASGGQYSTLNGTPVHDASQMFMFGNANLAQGFPNGLVYSQPQNQVLHSMGFASQHLDGTPISSTGNSFSQYSHFQEVSHEPTGALTKQSSEQAEKSVTQSSVSNSFMNDHFNVSSNQERNLFGPVFTQSSEFGGQSGNVNQVNNHRNESLQQFGGGQEQRGWPGHFSDKPTNVSPSQGLATLDPLEQKILFNTDDDSWGSSFGKHGNMGTGGFQNMFENTENSSTFPSVQSGSWSALMQSAVAEASSSDTGIQEEWSGLSFQNPEHSNDNQPSNFMESAKHQNSWLDNNLQNATSLSPKLELVDTSNASSGFPGFQHYPVTPLQFPNKEDTRADSSHESIHHSPKEVGQRLDRSAQQRGSLEGNASVQGFSPSQNAWPGKSYDHLQSDPPQQSMSLCNNDVQPLEYVNHSDRRSETMTNNQPQSCNTPAPEGSQKQSGQVRQQLSGYHQGLAREFTFVNNESNSSRDFKGFVPDIQRNLKASEEANFRSNDCSGLLDRSAGSPPPNSTTQTSHHMLELLQKVDKFRGYRTGMNSSYTDSAPTTEGPKAEHADASTPSYSHSSVSQYFGLRLAPPTQRAPVANYFDLAQISQQSGLPIVAVQSPQYDNNQIQNQNSAANHLRQATVSGIGNRYPTFSHDVSQETSHTVPVNQDGQQFSIHEAKQMMQGLTTSGITQKAAFSTRPPNVWVDVPAQQNPSGMGSYMAARGSPSTSDAPISRMETSSEASKELYYQKPLDGENNILETGSIDMNSQGLDGREQAGKIFSAEESLAGSSEANAPSSLVQGSFRVQYSGNQSPVISARDLETFGRCLRQTQVSHLSYSLLNPMLSDPSVRAATINERVDSDVKIPQVTNISQLSSHGNCGTLPVPSAGSGNQLVNNTYQSPLADPSQDTVTYKKEGYHNEFPGNNLAYNLAERSQMNFPMPPSWFKNGQVLPMYGAKVANNTAQQLLVGRPSEFPTNNSLMQVNLAASQYGSIWPTSGTNAITVTLSSPNELHSDGPNQDFINLKSKKRKLPTLELLPWYKEVTEDCASLQDISTAELEWAQAANRLPEKLKEEGQALGETLPVVRRKKRLTLATQLMQLLIRPAPAIIFSEDASAHYDILTYFTARLALGDACSLASHSHMGRDMSESSSGRDINDKSSRMQDLLKIVEGFIDRSKRLESEFLRLENRESIVDLRVESQELDKFALFNRFVKFHSRVHLVSADAAASGGTSTVQKFALQRYVTASQMPKTVPDCHNCLSL